MGFLGTAADAAKHFGEKLTEFSGIVLRALLGPPNSREVIQLLEGNTDGLTLDDTVGVLQEPEYRDVSVSNLVDGDTFEVSTGAIGTRGFSVSAWVKVPVDMAGNSHNICGSDQDLERSWRAYIVHTSGRFRLLTGVDGTGSGVTVSECPTDLRDNALHHIYVYYIDGRAHFYIDGKKISSGIAAATLYQSTLPTRLLSFDSGSGLSDNYRGKIARIQHTRENEPIPTIFMWGQSLAAGNGGDYGVLTPAERSTQPWSFSYNNPVPHVLPENFVDEPLQCLGTYYSVEVQICLDVMSQIGKRCAVVKFAIGGTEIKHFMKGGTYYQPMVDTYLNAVSALEAKGYAPYQYKFITLHGEADSTPELASIYESNFDTMVSDLESDLGVRLSNNIFVSRIVGTAGTEGSLLIKEAQASIGSRAGNRWFNNDGRPTVDGVHINGTGYASLGGEMSSIIISELASVETEDVIFNYTGEEGVGGWFDRSGNGYHSAEFDPSWTTLDGVPSTNAEGGFAKYINFKQATARMILNGPTNFGEDDFTTQITFNYTADGAYQVLLSLGTFTEFEVRVTPSNVVEALFLGTDVGSVTISDGWHTVVVGRSDGVVEIQVDGGVVEDQIGVGAITGTGDFVVGVRSNTGSIPFTGDVSQVEVTSSALTGVWASEDSSETIVSDSSGNGNAASLVDTGFKRVPSILEGTAAADGGLITNPGGYVDNNGGTKIIQTDFGIISHIKTTDNGVDSYLPYSTIKNSRPKYDDGSFYVEDSGSQWEYYATAGTTLRATNPSRSTHVPLNGWVDVLSTGFSVYYDSYWVENGEFVKRSYSDALARINLDQKLVDQWEKVGGVCLLKAQATYAQTLKESLVWYNGAVHWAEEYTDECGDIRGIVLEDGGEPVLGDLDEVIFEDA